MEDNPVLLRLKELEALEKVSEKVGNVIVGNGMDGVLEDLVRIRPRDREDMMPDPPGSRGADWCPGFYCLETGPGRSRKVEKERP